MNGEKCLRGPKNARRRQTYNAKITRSQCAITAMGAKETKSETFSPSCFSRAENAPNERWALQAAEKLNPMKGTGFSPYINQVISAWALAPEGCFSRVSPEISSFPAACLASRCGRFSSESSFLRTLFTLEGILTHYTIRRTGSAAWPYTGSLCTRYSSSRTAASTAVGTETIAPTTPARADPSSKAARIARPGRFTRFVIMRGMR